MDFGPFSQHWKLINTAPKQLLTFKNCYSHQEYYGIVFLTHEHETIQYQNYVYTLIFIPLYQNVSSTCGKCTKSIKETLFL